ncbi:MAG: hypothetical protein ASARMPREDX12_005376 [Alectoria sarmentosa]|nr:MAG: hypothetical protein ASARMPREDX12_005376 [Alectoria sarmentosa]
MAAEVLSLVSQLETAIQKVPKSEWDTQDAAIRRQASDTLRKLSLDLEDWGDLVDRVIYSPMDNVMIRLALDLGIFDIITAHTGPVDVETIVNEVGVADETLLRRILRTLDAMNAIGAVGEDGYEATNYTRAFTTQKGIAGQRFSFEFCAPAWNQIPYFLAKGGYRNPSNALDTPLQMAFNSQSHFFGLLQQRPGMLETFGTFMTCHMKGRPEFPEIYPVERELVDGLSDNEDAVLLVDVGGGLGQDISTLRQMVPTLRGRTILQELPEMVQSFPGTEGIEIMEYDFFEPQLVKGARAYYFRNIFHDWSDENCLKILDSTKSAMIPGYSKILINDLVVTQQKQGLFMTMSDMNMLALLGSMERSEKQWHELMEKAGLVIVKMWTKEARYESIIEVMLPV